VFSWAPPTIRRVMMWTIFIGGGGEIAWVMKKIHLNRNPMVQYMQPERE